jgi:hypothetical protein
MIDLRTCKCGRVYFGVSRAYAEAAVKRFNEYFDGLSPDTQRDFYGGNRSSIASYEQCWCGTSYKEFRPFKEGDCPDGVTMSPIIVEEE